MSRVCMACDARRPAAVVLVLLGLLACGGLVLGSGCYPKAQIYGVENVGGLIFKVNPPDAEVILDGVSQGVASEFTEERFLKVESGPHRLELRKAGYETYSRTVYVSNSLMRIEVTLVVGGAPASGGY
ncbi:MAG: PEGA domain-containing protein [Deltaproteobacteria bacterium]|nr:PEGA domain-containing protein [Deltaproteobacteria bacterium]